MVDGRFCVSVPLSLRNVLVRCFVLLALGAAAFAVGGETSAGQQSNGQLESWAPEAVEVADGAGVTVPTQDQASAGAAFGRWECPAVYAERLADSAEFRRLDAAFVRSSYVGKWAKDTARSDARIRGERGFLSAPRKWAVVPLPEGLADYLAGASVYVITGKHHTRLIVGYKDDRFYDLPAGLNRLLLDCGMRFQNDDAPTWIRTHYFFASAAQELSRRRPFDDTGLPELDADADSIVSGRIPLVRGFTVDSIVADTATTDSQATHNWPIDPGCVMHVKFRAKVVGRPSRFSDVVLHTSSGEDRTHHLIFPVFMGGRGAPKATLFDPLEIDWQEPDDSPTLTLLPNPLVYMRNQSGGLVWYATVRQEWHWGQVFTLDIWAWVG